MSVEKVNLAEEETRLAELYCICMENQSIPSLIERGGHKVLEMIQSDFITYLDLTTQTLHVVGRPLSDRETPRVHAHANRCLEGADKSPSDIDGIATINYSANAESNSKDTDADLLWTGAVDTDGRLTGVFTVYGQQRRLKSAEKSALRSARTLIGDAFARLNTLDQIHHENDVSNGVDVFVVSIDTELASGDITGLLMSKLQDAIAKRLAGSIPDAFMVAKLGLNRLMVVGHPDHPLPLEKWEKLCERAVASLNEKLDYRLQLTLSEGDLTGLQEAPICGLVSKPSLPIENRLEKSA